jgi:microcystin degradation protein MlrC
MRIAIGQLWQETNTFNPLPTTFADFEAFGILEGEELIAGMAETNELGGFIQTLRQWPERPTIVGLARLPAWPSGPASPECVAQLVERMTTALHRALPVEAVLLALHGAMVGAAEPDVEGLLLTKVRAIVGPTVPIVASLDLHANITRRMVSHADALVLYHTAPHIDVMDTGRRAARVLRRILVDGVKPEMVLRKLPMVVPAERANTQDPTSVSYPLREQLQQLERNPCILAAGLATVQPWLDIPEMGSAVVVVGADDRVLAERASCQLADHVWQHRRDFFLDPVPVDEAVRRAHAHSEGLVVLGDPADATTSGSPGDSTAILKELIRYDWPRPALVTLVAPDVVAEAEKRGLGASWTTTVGGKRDTRFSQPLSLPLTVQHTFHAKFVLTGHLAEKLPIDMGRSAVLRHGNVHIVATSRSGPHFAPQLFESAGLDPYAASVLVAKSPCGFRAAYAARAKEIIMVRAPGCSPSDFWRYPYHNIPRPLWPWDEIEHWNVNTHS